MQILRTPDERFANLAGYNPAPHYIEISCQNTPLRIHYLDEGPREAARRCC